MGSAIAGGWTVPFPSLFRDGQRKALREGFGDA